MNNSNNTTIFEGNSIQKKFSYGLISVVTLILVFFSTVVIFYNVKSLEAELEGQLTELSSLSAVTLPNALWQYNYEYINDFANSISLYKDIVFIKVIGKGKTIATKSRSKLLNKKFSFYYKSQDYLIKETKIVHNQFEIGKVQIVMTRERINKLIIFNSILAICLILVVIIAIITTNLLLSRKYLFKPLARLERSTKLIAEGNLNAIIDISAKDEIGKLAQSFSRMIQSIKSITASRDVLNHEIEERMKIEERLRDSEGKYRSLIDDVIDQVEAGIFILDSDFKVVWINKTLEKYFGLKREDIIGKDKRQLISEQIMYSFVDGEDFFNKIIATYNDNTYMENFECFITSSSDRKERWLEHWSRPIHSGFYKNGRIELYYDITSRKISEKKIKASLKEKNVLFSEIHHRVKNNMQVVVSLLSLQAEKISEKRIFDMFKESQSRIEAMAMVHEKMYLTSDLANIDFGEYVKSFVNSLAVSYGIGSDEITIHTNIKEITFDLDNAIPCALIINELVSNCLKYAFPDERTGEIRITLNEINEEEFELIVKDNGTGLPENFNFDDITTLGLHLTKTIVEHQLDGKIEIDKTGGTGFHILFKRQKYKARM